MPLLAVKILRIFLGKAKKKGPNFLEPFSKLNLPKKRLTL